MSNKVPAVRPRDTRRSGPKYAGSTMQSPRKWTPEEDELLRCAVEEIGAKHWKVVAERVPGRNHVQCLQRYLRVLQPGLKKGHWTPEEDEKLKSLASRGFTSWIEAAEQIPGRSAKQCRDRWRNHLEATIKHTPWEPEEDALLLELHAKQGNRWAAIARCLPGRTENAVKIHCKSLLARKAAMMDGSSLNNNFENTFDGREHAEDGGPVQGKHSHRKEYQGEGDLEEEEAEETTDDLSSISPLPSPMAFPSQWMRPWASPTNAGAGPRGNQFSLGSGPYGQPVTSQQSLPQPQAGNGVLRATRLQSFPPPLLTTNLVMRRNSLPAAQQLPQPPQTSSSSAGQGHRNLFPPVDTAVPIMFDPTPLMEHIPSPINSPTHSAYATSPTNQFGSHPSNNFKGAVPLNFRMDMPPVFRSSSNEGSADRFFLPNDQ